MREKKAFQLGSNHPSDPLLRQPRPCVCVCVCADSQARVCDGDDHTVSRLPLLLHHPVEPLVQALPPVRRRAALRLRCGWTEWLKGHLRSPEPAQCSEPGSNRLTSAFKALKCHIPAVVLDLIKFFIAGRQKSGERVGLRWSLSGGAPRGWKGVGSRRLLDILGPVCIT